MPRTTCWRPTNCLPNAPKPPKKPRAEAEKATEFLLSSKKDVGALASDLYRNGGINPGVVTLLEDTKENDVLYKASTMDALSANRTMTVSNAEDAAALWTAWQDYAAAAATAADEATAAQRTAAAEATIDTLQLSRIPSRRRKRLREELIGQLAFLHDVDADRGGRAHCRQGSGSRSQETAGTDRQCAPGRSLSRSS